MKTILTTIFLAITMIAGAQNQDLDISGFHEITNSIGECYPKETVTINNLNLLVDAILNLSGVDLVIAGNINLSWHKLTIYSDCNDFPVKVCVQGNIQHGNNIIYINSELVDCNNLSAPVFDINTDLNVPFVIHNLLGQEIKRGVTGAYMYSDLPKNTVYVVRVDGFEQFKIIM
jgi:hypothetical protein